MYKKFKYIWDYCTNNKGMSPKMFIQSHQEGKRYCEYELDVYRIQDTDRPGSRGGPTRGRPPKNI